MTPELETYIKDEIDARMDKIVEQVVKRVIAHMYEEVGKSVVKKALWVIGIGVIVLLTFLAGKGLLLKP